MLSNSENARFIKMLDAEISSAKVNIEHRLQDNDSQLKSYFAALKSQKEQFAKEMAQMQKENRDKLNETSSVLESFRNDLNELELSKQQTYLQALKLQKKMELTDPKFASHFKFLLVDGLESKLNIQESNSYSVGKKPTSLNQTNNPNFKVSEVMTDTAKLESKVEQHISFDKPSERISKSETQEVPFQNNNKLSHFAYESEDKTFEPQGLKSAPKIKKVESIKLAEPIEKVVAAPVTIKPYEPPSTFQNLKFESFADQNAKIITQISQATEPKNYVPMVQQVLPKSTSIINTEKGIDSPQTFKQEQSFENEKKKSLFDSYTSPFKKAINEVREIEKSTGQKPNQFNEKPSPPSNQPQVIVQKPAQSIQIGEKSPAFPKNDISQSSNNDWVWSSKKQSQQLSNKIPVKGNETSGFSSFQSIEKSQPTASNFGKPPVIQPTKNKQESFRSDEFDDLF